MLNNDKLHAGCGKGISRDMERARRWGVLESRLALQRLPAKIIFAKSIAYLGVANDWKPL